MLDTRDQLTSCCERYRKVAEFRGFFNPKLSGNAIDACSPNS